MAGLRQAIANILAPKQLVSQDTTLVRPNRPELTTSNYTPKIWNPYDTQSARNQIARACVNAYKSDSRVQAVVDTLSRDTVKGGFILNTKNSEAKDVALEMLDRVNAYDNLEDWMKVVFNYGNLYKQIVIDGDNNIVKLSPTPTLSMVRMTNVLDEFPDSTRAFRWQLNNNSDSMDDPIFPEWQIIHARWNHFDLDKYGRPLLASGLALWTKIQEGEKDMATARKTRAGIVRSHVLEDAQPDDIETYKQENENALGNGFASIVNFFSNKKTTIQQLEGSTTLPDIKDIQHLLESWFAASPVPMALVAYGGDLSRDVIDLKEKQYRRSIEQITTWMDRQMIIPLIKLQWQLKGINPLEVEYETTWASKDPLTTTDLRDIADAMLRFKATNTPDELIAYFLSKYVPNYDQQALVKMLVKAKEDSQIQQAGSTAGINGADGKNHFDPSRAGSTMKKMGVGLNRK